MKSLRALYHLVGADFLERTRRYSFLLVLGFAAFLAYGVFVDDIVVRLGMYRGVYNSAWIGSMMAWVSTTFLSLVGFYVVKNAILRDEVTRVGQVLATTPMRRSFYTLAKTLSNFTVLAAMVAVLASAAVVLELARAEHSQLEMGKLLAPFVWVVLPAMAITGALALLFETLPVLRGGVGNVLYFFLWGISLAISIESGFCDWPGYHVLYRSMSAALKAADPTYNGTFFLTLNVDPNLAAHLRAGKTFLWNGVDWTTPIILGRLLWVGVAAGIALLASLFFHRFDPARETRLPTLTEPSAGPTEPLDAPGSLPEAAAWASARRPLTVVTRKPRLRRVVLSELLLMLKGHRWWWYAIAALLFALSLLAPTSEVRSGAAAFAWLWPVLVWSQMGAREARNATESLIFSSESALSRQLPAQWMAGVVVAFLTGGGMGLSLLFNHDWHGVTAWIAGAFFVPSFALALGVWSGTSKPFEALYTALWYVGPMHRTPGLDFTGAAPTATSPTLYLFTTVMLLAVSYLGRRIKLAYP
jgi:putative Mn2+ efflux pump MntP